MLQVSLWVSLLLDLPYSTARAVVKWKHLGATSAQPQSGRRYKSPILCFVTHYRVPSCNISTRAVHLKLCEVGFHGQAAADHNSTMCKAKPKLGCCRAYLHWTLEQWKHPLEYLIMLHCLAVWWRNLPNIPNIYILPDLPDCILPTALVKEQ